MAQRVDPLRRVAHDIEKAFMLENAFACIQHLAEPIEESYRIYDAAFTHVQSTDDPESMDALIDLPDHLLYDGKLEEVYFSGIEHHPDLILHELPNELQTNASSEATLNFLLTKASACQVRLVDLFVEPGMSRPTSPSSAPYCVAISGLHLAAWTRDTVVCVVPRAKVRGTHSTEGFGEVQWRLSPCSGHGSLGVTV